MSKKANPTAIGLFVVVGVALAVIGLIIFSSGKLFSKQHRFILYFDSSVGGLNAGAPVKFRGVAIGSVVQVYIRHNQATNDYFMPVLIEIDEKRAQEKSDQHVNLASREYVEQAVRRGLRGKLDAESLVTGVLYVELGTRLAASPPVFHQLKPEYPEIPTVHTEIQELMSNLARLDLAGISEKLNLVLDRLDTRLNELNLDQIQAGVTNLLGSADRLLASRELTNSLAQLEQLLTDTRGLVQRLDRRVDPLADSITNTLSQAQHTIAELDQNLQNLGGMFEVDAPVRTDLARALDQVSDAARAVSDLAEFLRRNPNALLTGRKPRPLVP